MRRTFDCFGAKGRLKTSVRNSFKRHFEGNRRKQHTARKEALASADHLAALKRNDP
jgi:hypothetical protein